MSDTAILKFRKETLLPIYKEFKMDVSLMNTEGCRKYLEDTIRQKVTHEDVIWCFYHA